MSTFRFSSNVSMFFAVFSIPPLYILLKMLTKSTLLNIIVVFICGSVSTTNTFLLYLVASICATDVTEAVFPTPPLLFINAIVFIFSSSFLYIVLTIQLYFFDHILSSFSYKFRGQFCPLVFLHSKYQCFPQQVFRVPSHSVSFAIPLSMLSLVLW